MAKTDTDKLVQELGGMTVLDLVELKNKLEEEWGVSAAAPVAVAAPGAAAAGGGGAGAEGGEKSLDGVPTGARAKKNQGIQGGPRVTGPGPEEAQELLAGGA